MFRKEGVGRTSPSSLVYSVTSFFSEAWRAFSSWVNSCSFASNHISLHTTSSFETSFRISTAMSTAFSRFK